MTPRKKSDPIEVVKPAFQVKFENLTRTGLSCPCVWEGKCEKKQNVKITFRCGRLSVYYKDAMILEDGKDPFDISAYLSDEELLVLLKRHNLIKA